MSPVRVNTPDTLEMPSDAEKEQQEEVETYKDTSVGIATKGQEGPQVSCPHIEVNKEDQLYFPKALPSNNTSTTQTKKAIKNPSPNIEVSLDEVIAMP